MSSSAVTATTNMDTMSKNLYNHFTGADKSSYDVWVHTSKALIGKLARPLLPQMGLEANRTEPVTLLDNAAGTGVLAQELHALLPRSTLEAGSILASDSSEAMVSLMKQRSESEDWVNFEARALDAQDTELAENTFTHVTICLGLHIMPNPDAAVKDAIRVLKHGGIFGATTFPQHKENKFWFSDMRTAFAAMAFYAPFPEVMPMQMHSSGHWYDKAWLETHLPSLGLKGVKVTEQSGSYHVKSADEYMDFFALMLPFLLKTYWSEEQRAAHGLEEVKGLIHKHLVEKYNGKGWEIKWDNLYMTGHVDK